MKIKIYYTFLLICTLVVAPIAITKGQKFQKSNYPTVTITPGKSLKETSTGVKIVEGDSLLFEIKTSNGGDPRIDTRVISTLIFEIPENSTHFAFTDFKKNKAYVVISDCRCMDLGYNPVMRGVIKGKRLPDGQWKISADVIARGKDSGEERYFDYSE